MIAISNIDLERFHLLCDKTVERLNFMGDSLINHNGLKLEKVVAEEAIKAANDLKLGEDWSIKLVSGHKFPDIQVGKCFGIEVKTSKSDWKVPGGSVLESSRLDHVEHINIIFGRLVSPVEFKTRPYEDCLYEVAVTHSPRYLIDMELKEGETIFDKIGKTYEEIRRSDSPIKPFLDHKRQENPNAKFWWDHSSAEDVSPASITILNNLPPSEKRFLKAEGVVCFPEIFSKNQSKFQNLTIYWISKRSIVAPNLRDFFTSGGKFFINGKYLPAIYRTLYECKSEIRTYLSSYPREHYVNLWDYEDPNKEIKDIWFNLLTLYIFGSERDSYKDEIQELQNFIKSL